MSTLTNRIVESRNKLLASYDRVIDVLGRIKFTRLNTTTPTTLPTSATITASPNPPSIGGQTTYTITTNKSWTGTLYISYYQDAASGTGAGGTVPVSYNKSVAINNGTGSVAFALPFPNSVDSYNTLYVKVFTTDGQIATMGGNAIGSAVFTIKNATAPAPTSVNISASPSSPSITDNTTYTVTTGNNWNGTLYISYYQDAAAGTGAGGTVPVSYNRSVNIVNGSGAVAFPLPYPNSVSSYNTLHVKVFTTDGQIATMGGNAIGSAVFTLQTTASLPTSATITANPTSPSISGQTTYTVRTGTSWSGTLYISYYQDAAAGTGAGGTVPVSFNKTVSIVNGSGTIAFPIPFPESVSSYNTLYVKVFTTDGQIATMGGNAIGSATYNLLNSVPRTLSISNVSPNPLPLSGNVTFNINSTGLTDGTQVNWAISYMFRNSYLDDTAIYYNNVVTGTSTISNGSAFVSTPYPARSTGGKSQGYLNIKATTSNGSGGTIYSDDVNAGGTFTMSGSSGSGTVNLYTTADIYGNVKQDTFDTDEVTHVWVETTTSLTNVVVTVSNTWVKFQQADNTTNISPGKTYLGLALVAPSTPSSVVSVITLTSSQLTKTVSFTSLSSIN